MSLYKFTHIPLLKNDGQLKQKSDKQPKKEKQSPNLLKNKNHVPKNKSCLVKQKKKGQHLGKEKKKKKKKRGTNCPCASAHGHFRPLSNPFSPFSFLPILGRKLFGGPGEKTPLAHHLFSFLSIQLNTLQKSFSSHFLSKIFYQPYFSSKQTHP